jgi:hypothetical protein
MGQHKVRVLVKPAQSPDVLKAKVVVSEMENPEQKKVCALVVQNFENWLVAIGHRSKLKAVGISRFETDS